MGTGTIAAVEGGFLVLAGIAGCDTPDQQLETVEVEWTSNQTSSARPRPS